MTDHRDFLGFIKALTVPTFLPSMVQIHQAVAHKHATESKIDTYRQLFLLYGIRTIQPIIVIFRIHKGTVNTHVQVMFGLNRLGGC